MLFFYPSSESKTDSTSPPWSLIVFSMISLICFGVILGPRERAYRESFQSAQVVLGEALTYQYQRGQISDELYFDAQERPEIITLWRNRHVFSDQVKDAYRRLENMPLPLASLESSPLKRMLLMFTPHHFTLALLGAFCLWIAGFLAEHRFGRRLPLALLLLSAASWLLLSNYAPPSWQTFLPSPLFAWSGAVAVSVLSFWLTSPRAVVTMSLKIWLGRFVEIRPELPLAILPLVFFSAYFFVNQYLSSYSDYYSPLSMGALAIEGVVFAVALAFFSTRLKPDTPEQELNQQIARAESLFSGGRHEDALAILRDALENAPNLEQTRRVADLAWRHHHTGVAEQAYRALLKEALRAHTFLDALPLIEEMLFRSVPVPGHVLYAIAMLGVKQNQVAEARKLLPFMRDHDEIERPDLLNFYTLLIDKEMEKALPDRQFLLEGEAWLNRHCPDSQLLKRVRAYLQNNVAFAASEPEKKRVAIHQFLDIYLLDITVAKLRLQPVKGKEQNVPWTATMGFFGCHVADAKTRGYRGSILLKFKRRVYACQFSSERVKLKSESGATLSFEQAWALLKTHAPEDLPFHDLDEFEQIADAEAFPKKLEAFIEQQDI